MPCYLLSVLIGKTTAKIQALFHRGVLFSAENQPVLETSELSLHF